MLNLDKLTDEGFLFFDGAFGTMLQKENLLELGDLPPVLNITKSEEITGIHDAYVEAGSQVATSNTFEANRFKLEGSGYTVEEVVKAAVQNAKNSKALYTALDIGPTGELLEPMGTLSFQEAYDSFAEMVSAGKEADLIILETFSDLLEIKAALLAAKENSNLPVIASMTFTDDGRTFTGTDPVTAALTLQELGADAIGVNCSLGPGELQEIVDKILSVAQVPVIVQANAGLPVIKNGETVYEITPEEYLREIEIMAGKGVSIIGGCCGTTPDYISKIVDTLKNKKPKKPINIKEGALTSSTQSLVLGENLSIIGERINPTGKPRLKQALQTGSYDYIISEALSQQRQGADVLDINVGLPEIDEAEVIKKVINEVTAVCPLPLQIDSANAEALEAGLRIYPGLASVNSVNGTEKSLKTVLPLVKKYGASVIGLLLDENGIPKEASERVKIAERIIREAEKQGINQERIIIDPLVLTASAQQDQAQVTLDTISKIKEKFPKVHLTLGLSNVSFGLPAREIFNAVYLAAALAAGVDIPIVNPGSDKIQDVLHVFKVINNEDTGSAGYIDYYSDKKQEVERVEAPDSEKNLKDFILDGMSEAACQETSRLLELISPEEIIDTYFIPALAEVGSQFQSGEIFLPQLMQSAAAVQGAFEIIRSRSEEQGQETTSRGRILLATVKGDIHDIGKNIVKMMLENYGYEVIDLGNDVEAKEIIETVKRFQIPLVGLSALMTTTVDSMREVIEELKENNLDCKVMVGGAVLTSDYAQMIDADFYGPDAQSAVAIAESVFK